MTFYTRTQNNTFKKEKAKAVNFSSFFFFLRLIFWERKKILPDYMINDRFDTTSNKSLDSKDKKMVYKTSNIRENNIKLS